MKSNQTMLVEALAGNKNNLFATPKTPQDILDFIEKHPMHDRLSLYTVLCMMNNYNAELATKALADDKEGVRSHVEL